MSKENLKENIFDLPILLEKISKEPLNYKEAYFLQVQILTGALDNDQLLLVFRSLERGCSEDELIGFFDASRDSVPVIETGKDTLDIVGTGGDGFNTINISTMASLIVSASGQPVTKFGNRAATSVCGTADVLESLGANIEIPAEEIKDFLAKDNFVFLFAPYYHKAFKFVREARKIYGKKTYFNLIGPFLNPTNPSFRLIGTSDITQVENMLNILKHTGVTKSWIVHGAEGLDEISIVGDTLIWQYENGKVTHFKINPRDFGYDAGMIEDLKGGNADENARTLKNILSGKDKSSRSLAVIINAAAGMVVSNKCNTLEEGIRLAEDLIIGGEALNNLDTFIKLSKNFQTTNI